MVDRSPQLHQDSSSLTWRNTLFTLDLVRRSSDELHLRRNCERHVKPQEPFHIREVVVARRPQLVHVWYSFVLPLNDVYQPITNATNSEYSLLCFCFCFCFRFSFVFMFMFMFMFVFVCKNHVIE